MASARKQPLKNATFRVPSKVWQRAKKRAIDENRSLTDVVVRALETYAGAMTNPAAAVLADADRFVKARGRNQPARHLTSDELHQDDA
jgi:hypothetical protein